MAPDPGVDDRGNCYGTGTPGLEFRIDDDRREGRCRECGRWIGLVGSSSDRLTHHAPSTETAPNPHRTRNARLAARMNVAHWLGAERSQYADIKFGEDTRIRSDMIESMREHGVGIPGQWDVFITNQLRRTQLLGVENAVGRQALGKLVVMLTHALETAVEIHGPMPTPGVPSGTVEPWARM